MDVRRIEVERLCVVSAKPFERIVQELEAAVGHPDMTTFAKATKDAR